MATYKVIQDIEAEDKLVGPLSMRQFIYAGVAAFLGYLSVISVLKGASFLLVLFVPPMAFCLFFAWPWSPDQPTEVWALARIRFLFKPRRRIWDQTGVKELVTITAPKRVEKVYTDGLSQTEVRSRLSALADTIDSRGWAVKNSSLNLTAAPTYGTQAADSDRLISYGSLPQAVPDEDIADADDILDEQNNPIAHQFDEMINSSAQKRRSQLVDLLKGKTPAEAAPKAKAQPQQTPNDYWFMNQPAGTSAKPQPVAADDNVVFASPAQVTPGNSTDVAADPTAQDQAVLDAAHKQLDARDDSNAHLKTIDPNGPSQSKPAPDPVNMDLARNNDLNVATLARQAKKAKQQGDDGEVVISLR